MTKRLKRIETIIKMLNDNQNRGWPGKLVYQVPEFMRWEGKNEFPRSSDQLEDIVPVYIIKGTEAYFTAYFAHLLSIGCYVSLKYKDPHTVFIATHMANQAEIDPQYAVSLDSHLGLNTDAEMSENRMNVQVRYTCIATISAVVASCTAIIALLLI